MIASELHSIPVQPGLTKRETWRYNLLFFADKEKLCNKNKNKKRSSICPANFRFFSARKIHAQVHDLRGNGCKGKYRQQCRLKQTWHTSLPVLSSSFFTVSDVVIEIVHCTVARVRYLTLSMDLAIRMLLRLASCEGRGRQLPTTADIGWLMWKKDQSVIAHLKLDLHWNRESRYLISKVFELLVCRVSS